MSASRLCFLFDQWIDGDLSDSQRLAFETHLDDCKRCRLRMESWQELELDVTAAFGLFGASHPSQSETRQGVELPSVESLVIRVSSPNPFDEKIERNKPAKITRWYKARVLAVTLLLAVFANWMTRDYLNKPSPTSGHAVGDIDVIAVHPSGSDSVPNPTQFVSVNVVEPIIATRPVTTSRFTVVNVHPVFSPYEPESDD